MKIAIDARMLQYTRVGISVYTENLVIYLAKDFDIEINLILVQYKEEINLFDNIPNVKCFYIAPGYDEYIKRELWELKNLSMFLNELDIDVYHSPNYYLPYFKKPRSAMVVTMYDASLYAVPQYYKFFHKFLGKIHMFFSSGVADKIIFGSQHAQSEFKKYLGKECSTKGKPIYIGVPQEIFTEKTILQEDIDSVKKKFKISGKYIIAIGSVHPRKNYERLIEVMGAHSLAEYSLIICGAVAWKSESIFEKITHLKLSSRVQITGFIETEDMKTLLKGAEAMVFPSLYEGFGIPPLEAFSLGVPVVASGTTSIPEVVGDAAVLFDPLSVEDMREKIVSVVKDKELQNDLIEKGKKRLEFFSWEKCAKEHMSLYKEAYRHKKGNK